jgi:hypothetical protein
MSTLIPSENEPIADASPILYHELVEDTPRGELFRYVVPP